MNAPSSAAAGDDQVNVRAAAVQTLREPALPTLVPAEPAIRYESPHSVLLVTVGNIRITDGGSLGFRGTRSVKPARSSSSCRCPIVVGVGGVVVFTFEKQILLPSTIFGRPPSEQPLCVSSVPPLAHTAATGAPIQWPVAAAGRHAASPCCLLDLAYSCTGLPAAGRPEAAGHLHRQDDQEEAEGAALPLHCACSAFAAQTLPLSLLPGRADPRDTPAPERDGDAGEGGEQNTHPRSHMAAGAGQPQAAGDEQRGRRRPGGRAKSHEILRPFFPSDFGDSIAWHHRSLCLCAVGRTKEMVHTV